MTEGFTIPERGDQLPPVNEAARQVVADDIANATIGDVLRYRSVADEPDRASTYVKVGHDRWRRFVNGRHSATYGAERSDYEMRSVITARASRVYLWDVFAADSLPWLVEGAEVTHEQMEAAPAGARIRGGSRNVTCTKQEDGSWQRYDGMVYQVRNFTDPTQWHWHPSTPERQGLYAGKVLTTIEEVRQLPVNTVLTYREGRNYYLKVRENRWNASTASGEDTRGLYGYDDTFRLDGGHFSIHHLPPSPEVQQKMQEVRNAINYCARNNGYGWVRDAGFWKLGIERVPAAGTQIAFGAIGGLPKGSVVSFVGSPASAQAGQWGVYEVTEGMQNSTQAHLVAGTLAAANINAEYQATVLFAAPFTMPTYRGPNHFLHEVWELQRKFRATYSWCSAVEEALRYANLADPGNAPDVAVEPPAVGESIVRSNPTDVAKFALLPNGTVFQVNANGRQAVKMGNGHVYYTDDVSEVGPRARLTILTLPTTEVTTEVTTEAAAEPAPAF